MDYQTFQPAKDLSDFVKCYWTLKVPDGQHHEKQRIVPDGCIEMFFILGEDIKRYVSEEDFIIQPRTMVLGQITKPLFIQPLGKVDTFAIRFFPWGFTPFSKLPIKDLENIETPLAIIFDETIATDLTQRIRNANSTYQRIKYIEEFLLDRLKNKVDIEDIIKSTIDLILATKGNISINELSQNNPSIRRQLERRFSKLIGLSPKKLAKVTRLQSSLKQLLDSKGVSLTHLAYESDFYDQAHFIKEFKEFTGVTPKHFYTDDKLLLSSVFYAEK